MSDGIDEHMDRIVNIAKTVVENSDFPLSREVQATIRFHVDAICKLIENGEGFP